MPSKATNAHAGAAPLIHPDGDQCTWRFAPDDVVLAGGEIHVFCAAPSAFCHSLSRYRSLLSAAELERAAKFRFPADQDSYTIRHGLRRLLLSRYMMQEPSRIEFVYGANGKPEIKDGAASLFFNDSHSGDLALFALTSISAIGVDIECARPIPEFERIASHYFSPREVQAMRDLPPEERIAAFYSCWTGKEAYLKATGEGIATGLHNVEITLERRRAVALVLPADRQDQASWYLKSFLPAAGYIGAVVVKADAPCVRQWRIPLTW
jgi:4'-phosphopantetheinyl transferase